MYRDSTCLSSYRDRTCTVVTKIVHVQVQCMYRDDTCQVVTEIEELRLQYSLADGMEPGRTGWES